MMIRPFATITIGNTILAISAAVVLGISAYVEHTTGTIDVHSSTYIYDAFVGAFTIVAVLALVLLRVIKPSLASLKVEVGASALLWVLWLAAGIATTRFTDGDRAMCKHLDDLFNLPEFENADKEQLAIFRNILKSVCRDVHAQLAFIWIGFVVLTLATIYLVVLGAKKGNTGWNATLKGYEHDIRHRHDPFADPVGQVPGSVAGVVEPNEDPDFKP